jgi:hypothetical protein
MELASPFPWTMRPDHVPGVFNDLAPSRGTKTMGMMPHALTINVAIIEYNHASPSDKISELVPLRQLLEGSEEKGQDSVLAILCRMKLSLLHLTIRESDGLS